MGFYKKGAVIGQKYEVHGVLGEGGFGVVYLVYCQQTKSVYALKTFRDEHLVRKEARERFRREASMWVDLERHPYVVRAHIVDEISGRLYIGMEYIALDEQGLNSLAGYLQRRPPDLAQSLRWAIQICHGMEYAYSRGIRCHRDIKPPNILISQDKAVKITDFGLAGALDPSWSTPETQLHFRQGKVGLSVQTMEGVGFGTPTHMPPEQFINAAGCDERSDIYAFGIVLYQMATGGELPFLAPPPSDNSPAEQGRFWREMHRLHSELPVPKLNSRLFAYIRRCLEKDPAKRYASFGEVRPALEVLLKQTTGEVIRPPESREYDSREWNNKGVSLFSLSRFEEALRCCEKAIQLDPEYVRGWNNKGNAFHALSRFEDAVRCYDQALAVDPQYGWARNNKGNSLQRLGRLEEALQCHDAAIALDHRNVSAWNNRGNCLRHMGRFEDAVQCYDRALAIDDRETMVWLNKGATLRQLGRFDQAVYCLDRARILDPGDAELWINRGLCLEDLGRLEDALQCYDRTLALDRNAPVWNSKGSCLARLGRFDEALACFDQALAPDRRNYTAWSNKGSCLADLGRFEEALYCYEQALALSPGEKVALYGKGNSLFRLHRFDAALRCFDQALAIDPQFASACVNKALTEDALGLRENAADSYQRFLGIADPQDVARIEYARERLQELGRK